MPNLEVKRKLTAILSADVEGYSRLMSADEVGTIRTLTSYREAMSTLIKQNRGRVVDAPGDNLLAEFASVVDAMNCAVEIQRELAEKNLELPEDKRMQFRIGVNLGDVVEEKDRIYGDGVNIAARLESLAESGGICISGTVYDHIKNKVELEYENIGEQTVKNISEPIVVYRVLSFPGAAAHRVIKARKAMSTKIRNAAFAISALLVLGVAVFVIWNLYLRPAPSIEPASVEKMALPLPDKPSIAVLPFDNMSGDPDQEYFTDGITEEIITALSKTPKLFVIARNSTFTYKGKPIKVQQVRRELGVRYVLEGSVRKSGDKIRITAQLVDTTTGGHLWAERYDRELKEIFALQDEITLKIIAALRVELTDGEQSRLRGKGTKNLQAYLMWLHASEHFNSATIEGFARARRLLEETISQDPEFPQAYSLLGATHVWEVFYGSSTSPKKSFKQAAELTKKAITLDESFASAHSYLGLLYTFSGKYDKAIAESGRAVDLDPNDAFAHIQLGRALRWAGRHAEAVQHSEQALRLNPIPPGWYFRELGLNYLFTGRYDEAIAAFRKALNRVPNDIMTHLSLAVAYIKEGREAEARAEASEALKINPKFSLEELEKRLIFKNKADTDFKVNALRKAGLK